MEKQVTLEEQMICGALQTLNEEACEDVLDETEPRSVAAASRTLVGGGSSEVPGEFSVVTIYETEIGDRCGAGDAPVATAAAAVPVVAVTSAAAVAERIPWNDNSAAL